ncbi:hypothetical protein EON81_19415 [bacterium]|nr:MAG: hypothetical protein EON81_19415 [bacterium]
MGDGALPNAFSFEEWVKYVFDHPTEPPERWWSSSAIDWGEEANPERTLEYLIRLFSEPEFLITRFSRAQIDQGLAFVTSSWNHMFVWREEKIPWPERRRGLDAMIPLYIKLLAPVYGDDRGWGQSSPSERPTFACYMWWENIPLYGGLEHPDRDRINDAVLHVFEEVLKMDSEACLESVIHGLGHWFLYLPERTTPLILRFLERTDISPGLRRYATNALTGEIL